MKKQTRSKPHAHPGLNRKGARFGPAAKLKEFKGSLFQPVDALPLGIFRFLFGLLQCLEFFVVSRETFPYTYIKPSFHFTYPLFDLLGLEPVAQPTLWLIFHVLQISALGIMLGLFTRVCLILFTASFGYFFFMESSVYTNHYYLIFLLSFLLCLGHSGSTFSLDSLLRKNARRAQVDYWELFLLRFQICIVFFFGALAKMNADWLVYAAPIYLNLVKHFSLFGHPFHEKWFAVALSWGGMLSDLGLGMLLIAGRWYWLTFIWLCLFNGLNTFLFGLGIKTFPYLMVSTYILFLPTAVVQRAMAKILPETFSKHISGLGAT